MTYDNLKELAEKFFEQPGVSDIQMRFKEDRVIYPAINAVIDSRIDPLTLWSWAQCQNPKTLFVLKDWYNKDGNSGTVRESVEWSKQRWQDESKWDPTLTRLFWEWSRSDFTSNGGAWVINDVWGLKNTESATSSLSPKILDIGFKEIVEPIIAADHFEKIHLCGCWAEKYYAILVARFGLEKVVWRCHPGDRKNGWRDRVRYDGGIDEQ
jgi:hypothetical protein